MTTPTTSPPVPSEAGVVRDPLGHVVARGGADPVGPLGPALAGVVVAGAVLGAVTEGLLGCSTTVQECIPAGDGRREVPGSTTVGALLAAVGGGPADPARTTVLADVLQVATATGLDEALRWMLLPGQQPAPGSLRVTSRDPRGCWALEVTDEVLVDLAWSSRWPQLVTSGSVRATTPTTSRTGASDLDGRAAWRYADGTAVAGRGLDGWLARLDAGHPLGR